MPETARLVAQSRALWPALWGYLVKTLVALAFIAAAGLSAPSFAQTAAPAPAAAAPAAMPAATSFTNASVLGNYVVNGTETDGSKYDGEGPLAITMDKNGALELKWDGGKYVAIGQVEGTKLFAGGVADGRAFIMVMDLKPDGSAQGKWWRRTDAGIGGTEVWKKK
jgi:hypothetical protein